MMDVDQYDQLCDGRCPDGQHEAVHEAGHLVAALCVGIPVQYAVLNEDRSGDSEVGSAHVAPCDPEPRNWVPRNAVSAFRFLLGGLGAEVAGLGHAVFGHATDDVQFWSRGFRQHGESATEEQIEAILGKPFNGSLQDCIDWGSAHTERVRIIAARLLDLPRGQPLYASEACALLGPHCCGQDYPELCEYVLGSLHVAG